MNGTKNTMSFPQWRDAVNKMYGITLTDKEWAYYDLTLKYAQGFAVSEAVDFLELEIYLHLQ